MKQIKRIIDDLNQIQKEHQKKINEMQREYQKTLNELNVLKKELQRWKEYYNTQKSIKHYYRDKYIEQSERFKKILEDISDQNYIYEIAEEGYSDYVKNILLKEE